MPSPAISERPAREAWIEQTAISSQRPSGAAPARMSLHQKIKTPSAAIE